MTTAAWRRSSLGGADGDRVEVTHLEDVVAARDSRNPAAPGSSSPAPTGRSSGQDLKATRESRRGPSPSGPGTRSNAACSPGVPRRHRSRCPAVRRRRGPKGQVTRSATSSSCSMRSRRVGVTRPTTRLVAPASR
ncbi:DUF397 domain-containing protein [Streptosporangium sp. NPDC050855]|uniref:DUF397 domain-containing protein n=1 Tax=Streptosporangium sp. NPDC050855 TaxID=3366194 RepID=UPI0037A5F16F